MSELQVTARPAIHAGRLGEFKEVAERCLQSVLEKGSGTLHNAPMQSIDGED